MSAAALHALIRNGEAQLEHYARWAADHQAGLCASSPMPRDVDTAARYLRMRRAELAQLLSPPATVSHKESLAGSLVTQATAQAETLLQTP